MQCRSAVLPQKLQQQCAHAHCERRHLHSNPVSADTFISVCVWSLLFHEGSLLISH